ncbi:hypothetical protein RD110_08755 [Rhodoferax koreense]|uniref:Aminoglycoside phosphotransferase domain-containing protein n=1 Tax=Rhodoferax koreensis TaxID=1842727 RepID=A0A1P8JU41_9BURK|nr:bifunctional aminoglycoside phosphotransferase/ATP-binding protein [Rhodoferax koreense]APW37274.1 hypothetical protein RD110_08755 [Rhodoferax koreense]
MDASNSDIGPDPSLALALQQRLGEETGQRVELIETPISWVLLTERLVYKLKKPVRRPFLDFSTAALRKHFCEEELRLNRRLAPSLYLGVLPVRGTVAAPRLGGGGPEIDHVVAMRRFAKGALFSELLAAGGLEPAHVDALARRIADFHRDAQLVPLPAGAQADAADPVLDILRQLEEGAYPGETGALRAWVHEQAALLRDTWNFRLRSGLVRECHGDLHLGNVALVDGMPTAFDRLEFNESLRWTDVMSDVAFLTMDLKSRGRNDLAFRFLDVYLQHTGDYAGVAVLRFFEVYRALVRTLVEVGNDGPRRGALPSQAEAYFGLAVRLTRPDRAAARILITHGVSGSGKSSVAARLVEQQGAVRVRSDVERKRLFGLDPLQRSSGQPFDIYTEDATRQTFERMAEAARVAVRSGYPVIVDAAFLRHAQRHLFRELADELGVPFSILHCHADPVLLRARLHAREQAGDDPSEADDAVVERQRTFREPLRDEELPLVIDVCTDAPVDAKVLHARCLAVA